MENKFILIKYYFYFKYSMEGFISCCCCFLVFKSIALKKSQEDTIISSVTYFVFYNHLLSTYYV